MKKTIVIWSIAIAAAVLLVSLLLPSGKLDVSNESGAEGEVVYLTVSLNKAVPGDSVSVEYRYDDSVLSMKPGESAWIPEGTLQDFSLTDNRGVWTVEEPQELNGEICMIAFRIRPDADFRETKVECTLVVKNGSKQERRYTASGKITPSCTHSYSQWEIADETHSRSCAECGRKQNQSHNWVIEKTEAKGEEDVVILQCSICGAQRGVNAQIEGDMNTHDHTTPQWNGTWGSNNGIQTGSDFGGNPFGNPAGTEPVETEEVPQTEGSGWGGFGNGDFWGEWDSNVTEPTE